MNKPAVLIIDDEENIRDMLTEILIDEGYEPYSAANWDEAYKILIGNRIDVVLLDIWLPDVGGMEILEKIKMQFIGVEVIMISGHGKIELAVKAIKQGAFNFLEKPLSIEKTLQLVDNAIKIRRIKEENENLKSIVFKEVEMIGTSKAIQTIKEQIENAAASDARVLITGENGTGKELVARSIHLKSERRDKPFVEVNCAAIPDTLIESELFGYEKGAFTNAISQKKGKFEVADKGTVFLDEVADMSMQTQAKLLRVLQEMTFERVGGVKQITVDVRFVAATNKDIHEEIKEGGFRDDLLYRLNVIPIHVPPLRERVEDIPQLIEYFLMRFSVETGKKKKDISGDALNLLCNYQWPGNIRELKNIVERLNIMVSEDVIKEDNVKMYLPDSPAKNLKMPKANDLALKEAKDMFEREFIINKLKENDNNISQTAKALDIERSYLHKKIKTYNIKIIK